MDMEACIVSGLNRNDTDQQHNDSELFYARDILLRREIYTSHIFLFERCALNLCDIRSILSVVTATIIISIICASFSFSVRQSFSQLMCVSLCAAGSN